MFGDVRVRAQRLRERLAERLDGAVVGASTSPTSSNLKDETLRPARHRVPDQCSVCGLGEAGWRPASPAKLQGLRTGGIGLRVVRGEPVVDREESPCPLPPLLNAAGRRRSPATLPGYLAGRPPRNKGLRYPPDPPTVEEIVAVMRQAGDGVHGARLRALIVLLGRAALRINEALTLTKHDLGARRRIGTGPPRQGRPAPRGRHGPGGAGTSSGPGWS